MNKRKCKDELNKTQKINKKIVSEAKGFWRTHRDELFEKPLTQFDDLGRCFDPDHMPNYPSFDEYKTILDEMMNKKNDGHENMFSFNSENMQNELDSYLEQEMSVL